MTSFFHHRLVVNVLRLIWVLAILYYEYGIFVHSVRRCSWPDTLLLPSLPQSNRDTTATATTTLPPNSRPHHVLLVADPQIVDRHSYSRRSAPISYLSRLVVDLNMRKNWQAAMRKHPDTIVFLGDVMDSGRVDMPDYEYEALFDRFKSIFRMNRDVPVYHIPGNHDIGLGIARSFKMSLKAYGRYVTHFGAPNNEVSVANHTLVFFDAPKFVDEDLKRHGQRMSIKTWRPIQGGSWAFLKNFSKQEHTDPVILFSHIPLFRPDGKNCGPLRERGTIRPGAGEGYQNTLEKQSTSLLLGVVKPVAIFSGDDHDYCEYFHEIQPAEGGVRTMREVTVRSISMVMNIRRPGFQLLSLAPPELRRAGEPSYADQPCLLPDQIQIYLERYLPLVTITVLVVFFSSISGLGLPAAGRSLYPTPISDADEDLSPAAPRYAAGPPSSFKYYYQPRNHRSLRGRGWAMFQAAATRREPEPFLQFPNVLDTLRACCPRFPPATPLRRRRVWVRCLRDIRDIAIFPIAVFVLITWWVVS